VAVSSNFTLGSSAAQEISTPGAVATAYRYLHLTGVSGTTSSDNYTLELEISIGNPI